MLDPDPISYLTIARLYLTGNWGEALNVHWSPLFSWLITPLSAVFGGPLAAKVVCYLSGLLAIYAVARLLERFELQARTRRLVLWTTAFLMIEFALLRLGPDLLLAAWLLLYFGTIFDRAFPTARRAAIWCGLYGALAYFSKGYGFFFFGLHFTVMCALHWLTNTRERAAVVRQFATAMAVFALVSGCWIGLISAKAGRFTTSTTGDFNFRWVGPESPGYPQYGHLLRPPSPNAAGFWQQPPPASLPSWSPLGSKANMIHQARIIVENTRWLFGHWMEVSIFACALVLAYAVWGLGWGQGARVPWLLPLVTFLLYPAAYLLIVVQDRYLWPTTLLLLIFAGVVTEAISRQATPSVRFVLTLAVFGSFLVLPARMLIGSRHTGRPMATLAAKVEPFVKSTGRSPLWKATAASCASWNDSLTLAYRLNLQFYGTTGTTADEDAIQRTIHPNGKTPTTDLATRREAASSQFAAFQPELDYYFVWPACEAVPEAVLTRPEITGGTLPELRIYSLR